MEDKKQLTIESLKRAKAIMNRTEDIPRNTNNLNGVDISHLDTPQSATPKQVLPPQRKSGVTDSASRLPKEILESFMSNPIKEADRDVSFLTEGLQATPDDLGDAEYEEKPMPDMNELIKSKMQQRQQMGAPVRVNEATTGQSNASPTIDYSLIRMMIKETIKEEFDSLIESEGVAIIKLDKKLNVITSSGNVYTGDLKRSGNIKKG